MSLTFSDTNFLEGPIYDGINFLSEIEMWFARK